MPSEEKDLRNPEVGGGSIPGMRSEAAFSLSGPDPSPIPVIVAVPHAGRAYPDALTRQMRAPEEAAMRLEDRLVDRLGREIAKATGAQLLVAHAPRAMIDLNRAPEEIDWEMVPANQRPAGEKRAPNRRTRGGLGLVPRRVTGLGELWKRPLDIADLEARIGSIHAPYHAALASSLRRLCARWGAALLVDLHSMPPLDAGGQGAVAQVVVGDRFGSTCEGSLTASAFALLAQRGIPAAHNRPYAGGYTLERHSDRQAGLNAMQIEVDRSAYLDARLAETGPGFAPTAQMLAGLVRRLGTETAQLGRERRSDAWPEAAE